VLMVVKGYQYHVVELLCSVKRFLIFFINSVFFYFSPIFNPDFAFG